MGNTTGDSVIVPIEIKEIHGPSPANRKSVTIGGYMCRRSTTTTSWGYSTWKGLYGELDPRESRRGRDHDAL